MKVTATIFAFATTLVAANFASADMPGKDWMPADQVKAKLTLAGYTNITDFEADDGHWEGEGTKNGVRMEFHVDARTGEIISEKPDHHD